jgi:hypothetical protein
MRCVALVVLAACHAQPLAAPKPALEAIGPVPAVIASLEHQPHSWLTGIGTLEALGQNYEANACFRTLLPRFQDLYWAYVPDDTGGAPLELIRSDVTANDVLRCINSEVAKRRASTDPRIVVLDSLDGTSALAVIAPGWLAHSTRPELIAALLASPPNARFVPLAHPLGEHWIVDARDFTHEVLGVPSRGIVYDAPVIGEGRIRGVMYFADEDTARIALERFVHPENYPPVARAAIFELVQEARDFALAHGTLHIAGATIVFEGNAPFAIPDERDPTAFFRLSAR